MLEKYFQFYVSWKWVKHESLVKQSNWVSRRSIQTQTQTQTQTAINAQTIFVIFHIFLFLLLG
jgi:hypothetical protein